MIPVTVSRCCDNIVIQFIVLMVFLMLFQRMLSQLYRKLNKVSIIYTSHAIVAILYLFFSFFYFLFYSSLSFSSSRSAMTRKMHATSFSISKHCTKRVTVYLHEDFSEELLKSVSLGRNVYGDDVCIHIGGKILFNVPISGS